MVSACAASAKSIRRRVDGPYVTAHGAGPIGADWLLGTSWLPGAANGPTLTILSNGFCEPSGWPWVRVWALPHCHCDGSSPKVTLRCCRLLSQASLTVSARWPSHHGESAEAARRGKAASTTRVVSRVLNIASPSFG